MLRAGGGSYAPQPSTSSSYTRYPNPPPSSSSRPSTGGRPSTNSSRYTPPTPGTSRWISGTSHRFPAPRPGPYRTAIAGNRASKSSSRTAPYRVSSHHSQLQLHGQVRHLGPQAPHGSPPASNSQHKLCQICTKPGKQIRHKHFSSLRLRQILGVESSGQAYLCPSCKSRHRPYTEARVKITVSDSTLHEFFAPPGYTQTQYEGDVMHCDYITIPGACMDTLFDAFRMDCAILPPDKPIDVVLVMGYNDLVKGHSRHFMMECFNCFSNYVFELARKHHPDTPNTVAIASMMYPPQLAWFYDNGIEPANYVNEMEKINWLNSQEFVSLLSSLPYVRSPHVHTILQGQVWQRARVSREIPPLGTLAGTGEDQHATS